MKLDELKKIEDKTNILIFLCNKSGGQIPGKIYQYAASNKTILFILDGSVEEKEVLKDFFEKYNRFVFCDNNVSSIKNAINMIEDGHIEINNTPLTDFEPIKIIQNILGGK